MLVPPSDAAYPRRSLLCQHALETRMLQKADVVFVELSLFWGAGAGRRPAGRPAAPLVNLGDLGIHSALTREGGGLHILARVDDRYWGIRESSRTPQRAKGKCISVTAVAHQLQSNACWSLRHSVSGNRVESVWCSPARFLLTLGSQTSPVFNGLKTIRLYSLQQQQTTRFLKARGAFSRIDLTLGHKTSVKNFKSLKSHKVSFSITVESH